MVPPFDQQACEPLPAGRLPLLLNRWRLLPLDSIGWKLLDVDCDVVRSKEDRCESGWQ
jgi:hypothetical protein